MKLKFVEQALEQAPQHPLVLNAAAGFLQRLGKSAQAREVYRRAVALDSDSKVLWLNLATACRALGDTQPEIQALDRALAIEPRYVAALLHKADLLERLGRPKAAVQMFEDQRQPTRIALGRRVAVAVAIANRRDRSPEVVEILCLED
jgi:aspartate beta-hydroxylase